MPKARCTSYTLAFKLKVIAEAEAVENNSEIRLSESMVRRWWRDQGVLFNGELKMSARWKTMGRYIAKYPELDQQLFKWFTEQRSQGENSFVMFLFFFFDETKNEMNLSRNFFTASVVCIVSHFNSLVGTNTSDWLESCGVKTMLSKQSLHSARSIYIFHSELNVIACVVLGIAVSGLMLRLKAKELANDPTPPSDGIKNGSGAIPPSEANSGSTPARWLKIRSAVSPLRDSSQTANAVSTGENLQHGWDPDAVRATFIANPWVNDQTSVYTFARLIRE